MSVLDYVSGGSGLGVGQLRFFSEEEALVGVPGTWVNPINHKTSVGPPFSGKKSGYYARSGDEGFLSADMVCLADDIETLLAAATIPAFHARCTLKDEPVKPGKEARVFMILSAASNTWIKRVLGPIAVVMRRFPAFFESSVGIDMSSSDCMRVVE